MPFTEFYCDQANGSNLNGGSDAGSPSMSDTAGTGGWVSGTNIYTSVATNGSVAVGQFMSIYSSGATAPAYTALITAVSGGSGSVWVITLSSTAISGNKPSTGSTYFAQVGGAWKGPVGAVNHPFNFVANTLTDAGGDCPRVNFKNNASYLPTSAITHSLTGTVVFQGYTATPGDGGKAIIDAGTNAILVLAVTGALNQLVDLIITNNGTGNNAGFSLSAGRTLVLRCVAHNIGGSGFTCNSLTTLTECEAYTCNTSNTATNGGFMTTAGASHYNRCIAHGNTTGTATNGFSNSGATTSVMILTDCISDGNSFVGFYINSSGGAILKNCVAYNNSYGLYANNSQSYVYAENSLFISNTNFGVQAGGASLNWTMLQSCAFYGNSSPTSLLNDAQIIGSITLTGNPFVSVSTGNFALNNTAGAGASARAAGLGAFTQIGYTGATVSYPDVGPAQVTDTGGTTGGGGGILKRRSCRRL